MVFEKSKFIWINDEEKIDTYAEFYTKLQIAGSPAICNISVDGDYTLFINGKYVASNQYGDYEHYKVYDTIDITPFTHTGANDFALLCWHFGESSSRYKAYDAGVIFEVVEGCEVVLASDESVLARKSRAYKSGFKRLISGQLGFSFSYDARCEDSWALGLGVGFEKAIPASKICNFVPRPTKKLMLGDTVWATELYADNKSEIYDLGREVVGLITLECEGDGEANIAWGECLEGGHVKRIIGGRDFSLEYACRDDKHYTNYMLRIACRYLEITTQGALKIKKVGVIPQFYELESKNYDFTTGIDNDIYRICLNTLSLCMMEHYVDCPWREQCLYAFDSRNQMLCGYYAFEGGNFEYSRANLMLLAQSQRPDGLLAICSPCGVDLAIPSFSLHFINAVREYCEHSGDTSFFLSTQDKIKAILDAFLAREENGAIYRFDKDGYWNFYDWSPHLSGDLGCEQMRGTDIVLSSLVILALSSYERLCDMAELPFEYEGALDKIRVRARECFFDTESGLFSFTEATRESLELANSLAILAGICEGDETIKICEALARGELTSCSLSMKCFKYDALLLCDKEKYAKAVLDEIRATYEKMIPVGTVWETEIGSSDFDNAGSLCHGWSSIPIYYYHKLLK